jgi:hypothetical protein
MAEVKRWSTKKRIVSSILFSLIILAGALAIGTGLYEIGLKTGLITQFDLKRQVFKEIWQNPELLQKFWAAMQQTTCTNQDLHFTVSYGGEWTATPTDDEHACTELVYEPPNGNKAYLKIQGYQRPMAETIKNKLKGLQEVETNEFIHPLYQATLIQGLAAGVPVAEIILKTDETTNYSLINYPAEVTLDPSVEAIVRSFRQINKS